MIKCVTLHGGVLFSRNRTKTMENKTITPTETTNETAPHRVIA